MLNAFTSEAFLSVPGSRLEKNSSGEDCEADSYLVGDVSSAAYKTPAWRSNPNFFKVIFYRNYQVIGLNYAGYL